MPRYGKCRPDAANIRTEHSAAHPAEICSGRIPMPVAASHRATQHSRVRVATIGSTTRPQSRSLARRRTEQAHRQREYGERRHRAADVQRLHDRLGSAAHPRPAEPHPSHADDDRQAAGFRRAACAAASEQDVAAVLSDLIDQSAALCDTPSATHASAIAAIHRPAITERMAINARAACRTISFAEHSRDTRLRDEAGKRAVASRRQASDVVHEHHRYRARRSSSTRIVPAAEPMLADPSSASRNSSRST